MAESVAEGLGIPVPRKLDKPLNMSLPADVDPKKLQPKHLITTPEESPSLRQIDNPNFPEVSEKTRKVAVLIADGFDDKALEQFNQALLTAGATPRTVAPRLGVAVGADGKEVKIDFSFLTASSVLFDAVFIPDGEESAAALLKDNAATDFVKEAFKHCKTIGGSGAGLNFLNAALEGKLDDESGTVAGIVADSDASVGERAAAFIDALAAHKHWDREQITMPL